MSETAVPRSLAALFKSLGAGAPAPEALGRMLYALTDDVIARVQAHLEAGRESAIAEELERLFLPPTPSVLVPSGTLGGGAEDPTVIAQDSTRRVEADTVAEVPSRGARSDTALESVVGPPPGPPDGPGLPRLIGERIMKALADADEILRGQSERSYPGDIPNIIAREVLDAVIRFCPEAATERIVLALIESEPFVDVRLMNRGGMGWIFTARSRGTGERVAIKVPQAALAPEIAALYEQEMLFLRTISENSLDEDGWLTHMVREGTLAVASQQYSFAVLSYYTGPRRRIMVDGQGLETDQALTLKELLPVFPGLPAVVSALLCESMLRALIEIQEMGFIHGDLKPANYLVQPIVAELLYPLALAPGPLSEEALGLLLRRVAEVKVRVVTADFGGVREMRSFLLGDEVKDQETGEAVVVQTPAYANATGIHRRGALAHSDRHTVAAVLFEMLSGRQAWRLKVAGRYEAPPDLGEDARELLAVALAVLNDPREDEVHDDSAVEVSRTRVFLEGVRRVIKANEGRTRGGVIAGMRRTATQALKRITGLGKRAELERRLQDDANSAAPD